ncbi:MAG: ABC transporter permease [Firmicutes bacterium]|nr:ABC transporter permease [Bacillota bacterium]
MKLGFYPRLAKEGIRKNKQLYIPYLLTCACMSAVFYILNYLATGDLLSHTHGGESAQTVLALGFVVILIFSGIFLIYTNSFLIRRRKKEFGLYNILGMNKKNIGRILFWETIISLVISLTGGILAGILLSKGSELLLMNMMENEVGFHMSISWGSVLTTIVVYTFIHGIIFLKTMVSITFSNPIELVRADTFGEKNPKANWLLGIAGVVILGFAYIIAITIRDPISALFLFFVAVVLVIIATYLLMISGSVLMCKLLQKNKNYYYNKKHFVSISQLVYRMKRNGAGLASICILMTMVLVTISTTSCMYFGSRAAMEHRYPRDYMVQYDFQGTDTTKVDELRSYIMDTLKEKNVEYSDVVEEITTSLPGARLSKDYIEIDYNAVNGYSSLDKLCYIRFVSIDEYNQHTGKNITLKDDECLSYSLRTDDLGKTITMGNKEYKVIEIIEQEEDVVLGGDAVSDIVPSIYLVVNQMPSITNDKGEDMLERCWHFCLNWKLDKEADALLDQEMNDYMFNNIVPGERLFTDTKEQGRSDYIGLYGTFFYLGSLLSFVFLISAVLIIYYKQICEGYEDEARFNIMQKVGMKKEDIKKSINSQMLTIFIFPIALAVVHLVFAFPMIQKILLLFGILDLKLLISMTAISCLICTIIYVVVYKITSNTYYKIVSH